MLLTPSQFAWACCQAGEYPPPMPKRGPQYGPDAVCYLCGGATHGVGWHKKDALGLSFTDIAQTQNTGSTTVCQSCVATTQAYGWQQYVTAHPERGLSAHFPIKDGKEPRLWNWLYSHHLFVGPDHHECPDRARWRQVLAHPPEPPFLMVIAPMGKKQLIFKSRIAHDRMLFPLQMDDEALLVSPADFVEALADFDRLYQLGFSKDAILTGDYHNKTLLDVGLSRWREAEATALGWRKRAPQLWAVCHYVAQRPEGWEPPTRIDYAPHCVKKNDAKKTPPERGQVGLF